MKKTLMMMGAAAILVLLGIGIYQTDALEKGSLIREDDITELIASQYPGEIKTIKQYSDSYTLEIEHEGAVYKLIVDGYDGSVRELIESGKQTAKEEPELEETSPPEDGTESPAFKEGKSTTEEQKEEYSNFKTMIVKKETDPTDDPAKQETKEEKTEKKTKETTGKKTGKKTEKKPKKKQNEKREDQQKKTETNKQEQQEEQIQAVITEKEAVDIALREFPGEIEEMQLNEDDDRLLYEISVVRDDLEAEMEIDAYSGDIIYIEIED